MTNRLNFLLETTRRQPFNGAGAPVALPHAFQDCWSRRIDGENRLVYLVEEDDIVVLQARYHYER